MNKLLFILLLLCCSEVSSGQTYQYVPIGRDSSVWKMFNVQGYQQGSYICSRYQYTITGRTSIVNADTFHEVSFLGFEDGYPGYHQPNTGHCDFTSAFATPLKDANGPGYFWMMEKNRKIYTMNSPFLDTSTQKSFFNFNVTKVGDQAGPDSLDTVVYIDTITINGTYRRRFAVRQSSIYYMYPNRADTVIEGIGSIFFGLWTKDMLRIGISDVPASFVVCFSVKNQQEYNPHNSPCADMWPAGVGDMERDNKGPVISPNPFVNSIQLETDKGSNIHIYNAIGKLVYMGQSVTDQKQSIATSDWPPGLYLVIIEKEGNSTSRKLVKN